MLTPAALITCMVSAVRLYPMDTWYGQGAAGSARGSTPGGSAQDPLFTTGA